MIKKILLIILIGYGVFNGDVHAASNTFLAEDNTLDSYYFELASEVKKGNLEKIETTTSEPEVVVKNTNNSALYKTFLSRVSSHCCMGEEWSEYITSCILDNCSKYNVDPFLAFSLFEQESGFNMSAISSVGAIGITQLMPDTASNMGYNPYDTAQNIEGGVQYLSYQLKRFEYAGNLQNTYAIAAYNAGAGAVQKYGDVPPYRETINHVNSIAAIYNQLLKSYNIYCATEQ